MIEAIKTFIENNIDLIENQDWENLFVIWHEETPEDWWNLADDRHLFAELIYVLKSSGIDVDLSKRDIVLRNILHDALEAERRNPDTPIQRYIGAYAILSDLNSYFGYTEEEVLQIMDDVATDMGLRPTTVYGRGYTWNV